ncbi:MAG: RnfABCDGE type electron transport complex subunit G [Lachnospiraceae bacterium]|nr:RnfABCDGE type electron transport complex subunit G [Lachnospiraceae bacterium]
MSVNVQPKQIIGPTLRLFLIATVTTILLALTNGITADKIAQNQIEADIQSRQEVLPAADSFEEKTITVDGTEITYYEASNGAGCVFSTSAKGYGGDVVVMTGISSDGTITGVKITEHSETAGLGAKWATTDAADQFAGMTAPESGVFAVEKDGGTVVQVAGATITSRAVASCVTQAYSLFKTVTGGGN